MARVVKKSGPIPGKISKLDGLPELLTRQDLAELFGVHSETVKRLEREGKLPKRIRVSGKIVRYTKASIQKFLEDAAAP